MTILSSGFHDAFSLYGRSKHYNWDRDDPESLFFGYYGHPKMSVSRKEMPNRLAGIESIP